MHRSTIEELMRRLCEMQASDLILSAGAAPQVRLKGELQPLDPRVLTPDDTREYARALLTARQFQALEERQGLDISWGIEGVCRCRINFYRQRGSIALAIRAVPINIPSFEQLGLPPILRDFATRPHGLVLITGPAGSGKSTTLAAMIDHINATRRVHVVCLEDPIEYLHANRGSVVDQLEIGQDAPGFAEALRGVFRQSPDVIMIGEMRDLETVQMALTLAETGHLILATLHTQDTTHAIHRVIDVFPSDQQSQVKVQLSLVLVGIVSQQLIPAHDGSGLLLATEIMSVNNAIRNLIRDAPQQIYSVLETSQSQGMLTMNESLRRFWADGRIDADTALQRSPRPKELMRLLSLRS
jgi:twitching motility protein PilT